MDDWQVEVYMEAFRQIRLITGLSYEHEIIDRYEHQHAYLKDMDDKIVFLRSQISKIKKEQEQMKVGLRPALIGDGGVSLWREDDWREKIRDCKCRLGHTHTEKKRDTYIHIRPSKHPSTPAHVRTHA